MYFLVFCNIITLSERQKVLYFDDKSISGIVYENTLIHEIPAYPVEIWTYENLKKIAHQIVSISRIDKLKGCSKASFSS